MSFNITKNFIVTNARQVPYVSSATPVITDPYFSSVSLLQGNTTRSGVILDDSTNNFTSSITGTTVAQGSVTPFTGSGGSVFMSGSSYISLPSSAAFNWNAGGTDLTIECWVKLSEFASPNVCIWTTSTALSDGHTSLYYYPDGSIEIGRVGINSLGAQGVTAGVLQIGVWTHIAVVRKASSTTTTIYINGTSVASGTTNVWSTGDRLFAIGKWFNSTPTLRGYVSNLRVVNGTEVYTGNFTKPTAPLTAITNTKLLLKFDNAKFFDVKRLSNLGAGGTAAYSATSPYGVSAGSLSTTGATGGTGYGTGWLIAKDNNTAFAFGTADFTVEWWYRLNNVDGALDQGVLVTNPIGVQGNYFLSYKNSSPNKLFTINNGGIWISGSATVAAATWYHVAFSRVSGTGRLFINGVLDGTRADTINYISGPLTVIGSFNGEVQSMNGNITDLRVTKGVGRYTASFTLPTGSFPTS